MKTTVNERIKLLRTHLDLSQTEFGSRIDIGQVSVYKIESGENNPSFKTLKSIIIAFNVNPTWLKEGKGEMFAEAKEIQGENPWKDVALLELQSKNTFLEKEVERLHSIIAYFTNNVQQKAANFLKAPKEAAVIELYPAFQETGS